MGCSSIFLQTSNDVVKIDKGQFTRRQACVCLWPRKPYPPSRQMPRLDARHERVPCAMPHGRACYCGRSFGEHVTCLCVLKASGEQHEEMPNLGVKT